MITFTNVNFKYKASLSQDKTFKSLIVRPSRYYTKSSTSEGSVKNINFTICKGEKVGIVGQNGAGKTTLIRLIGGILKPKTGGITVSGTVSPLIGLGFGMDPNMSVVESLKLYFLYRGCEPSLLNELIHSVVERAGLEDLSEELVGTLSSGTLARLHFYAGITIKSEIMLFDEFSAVGDAAFIKKSRKDLDEFIKDSSTLINVSHNLDYIREVSQRCMWVMDGEIFMDGVTSDVLEKYEQYFNG
jgi:ABC-type polysaccharide/polyol phosphate transport system ATPase subunit